MSNIDPAKEAARAANMICAIVKDCFWTLFEQHQEDDQSPHPETAFVPLQFRLLSDAKASLLEQYTKRKTVFISSPGPLSIWIPQEMAFQIKPGFEATFKQIIVESVNALEQSLRAEYKEVVAEMEAPDDEPVVIEAPSETEATDEATE